MVLSTVCMRQRWFALFSLALLTLGCGPSDSERKSWITQIDEMAEQERGQLVSRLFERQHPEMHELIVGSQSMNQEERVYCFNTFPFMTVE